jgi:hypothetical protein
MDASLFLSFLMQAWFLSFKYGFIAPIILS